MPRARHSKMDHKLAERCRDLVIHTAKRYGVPPVLITAHVRRVDVDRARFEVWNGMVHGFGMSRQLVADIFGRDRRRLRESVLAATRAEDDEESMGLELDHAGGRPLPMPFVPVRDQFVWCFAVPTVRDRGVTVGPFMKQVPAKVKERMDNEQRLELARFYQREARALRKMAAAG